MGDLLAIRVSTVISDREPPYSDIDRVDVEQAEFHIGESHVEAH